MIYEYLKFILINNKKYIIYENFEIHQTVLLCRCLSLYYIYTIFFIITNTEKYVHSVQFKIEDKTLRVWYEFPNAANLKTRELQNFIYSRNIP